MNPWSDETTCQAGLVGKKTGYKPVFGLARWAAVCGAALLALSAQATLVTPISVDLVAPGGFPGNPAPIAVSQTVSYGASIHQGGGGPIGGDASNGDLYMLPGEEIRLDGDSILIHVAQGVDGPNGNPSGFTGYLGANGGTAHYQFNGLGVLNRTISGAGFALVIGDGYVTGGTFGIVSDVNVYWLDPNNMTTLLFDLDNLQFADRPGGSSGNFAEFRIAILSTPNVTPPNDVPEPGTLVLAAAGLIALRSVPKRRVARKAEPITDHV